MSFLLFASRVCWVSGGEHGWANWSMLDFNAFDAVVDATHRYHEIFYEKDA